MVYHIYYLDHCGIGHHESYTNVGLYLLRHEELEAEGYHILED